MINSFQLRTDIEQYLEDVPPLQRGRRDIAMLSVLLSGSKPDQDSNIQG